jgi:soluble lytic murein transglycosylase
VLPFAVLCLLSICAAAAAEDTEGMIYLREGKSDLENERYVDAIEKLTYAEKKVVLLQDYTFLYLSEAHHKLEEHDKSLDAARKLLKMHPRSPLKQKARIIEIREATENKDGHLLPLFESYMRDYPEDEKVYFKYGVFLRESGNRDKALSVFKSIYKSGGTLSHDARAELSPSDITVSDLIERASNLSEAYEFRSAEKDLRKALAYNDKKRKHVILIKLAYTLFRQKRYTEAAEIYDELNDTYFKCRSLYRAGDSEEFDRCLKKLLDEQDPGAGLLLVADAEDKRRDMDYQSALRIYNNVLKKYSSAKEPAQWGIGWTYYLMGDYEKATEVFSELYHAYDDPKYIYWKARSLEAGGGDPSGPYSELILTGSNYYSFLAQSIRKKEIGTPVALEKTVVPVPPRNSNKFDRVEALWSIGMNKEASWELTLLSKSISTPEDFIYVVTKLQQLGDFSQAIRLASRIPYSEKLHRFWYPLAFWETVQRTSGKYSLDPFIVLSIMREESRFDADARSVAGARGLMQIMPQTAYVLDRRLKLGIVKESQINDVDINVHLGIFYLRSLFNEFESSLAHVLAAYNAGARIVWKWRQRGNYRSVDEFIEDISYPETRNYVKKVITSYFQYRKFSSPGASDADLEAILGTF